MALPRPPLPSRRWLRLALPLALIAVLLGAGGLAAFETDTVGSYGEGLMWALSLMTTVGFVGGLPASVAGKLIAAALMLLGFGLLTLSTAAVSSLLVREDERPADARDAAFEADVRALLGEIRGRLDELEARVGATAPPPDGRATGVER